MTFFFSSLGHSRWFAGKHWETEQRHSIPHQAFTETIQGNRIFVCVVCLCTVPSPVICFFSFLLLFSVQQKLQHQMILLLELDKTELLCLFKFIFFIVFSQFLINMFIFIQGPSVCQRIRPLVLHRVEVTAVKGKYLIYVYLPIWKILLALLLSVLSVILIIVSCLYI